MVSNGAPPQRCSAAAAASLRRRRGGGAAGAAAGASSAMLQFYADNTTGNKLSPNAVLIMSVGFIAVVSLLHVIGSMLFLTR